MYALHNNIPLQFRSNNGYIVTYGKLYGLLCGDTQIQNLMHFGTQFCQIALSVLMDPKAGHDSSSAHNIMGREEMLWGHDGSHYPDLDLELQHCGSTN